MLKKGGGRTKEGRRARRNYVYIIFQEAYMVDVHLPYVHVQYI